MSILPIELETVMKEPGLLFQPKRPEPSYPDLPVASADGESNIPGIYLAGEVAGTPLIKLGLNQGFERVEQLAEALKQDTTTADDLYDLVIIGAGASGFGAMVRAHELGLRAVCIDANRFANTIQNMFRGKHLFAEPKAVPQLGSVWFEECTKEELLARWNAQREALNLDIREFEAVTDIQSAGDYKRVRTVKDEYLAKKVLLCIGKSGNPRKAGVPGEEEHAARVFHSFSDPDAYNNQDVFIYGGGDVALEAAIALASKNRVVLATIDTDFIYPKKRNIDALLELVKAGSVELHMDTRLASIEENSVTLHTPDGTLERPADVVFEMIGSVLPLAFFDTIGIRLQSKWSTAKKLTLAVSLLLVYMLYALKSSTPVFPFTLLGGDGGGNGAFPVLYNLGGRSTAQDSISGVLDAATHTIGLVGHNAWYALLYTVVVLFFGLRAAKRWGKDDPHQRWRFASIIFFQIFFFILVEVILINVMSFFGGEEVAKHYWRGWGLAQPFPLFYNTPMWWYDDPLWLKTTFMGSGLLLTFVAIPLFVRWQGMRFCTWVCGCGGLAETLGDTWRDLSPKGSRSRLWEFQGPLIMFWAFGSAAVIVLAFQTHGDNYVWSSYSYIVDFWLVAVLPVGFYPFFGGKIWCRYWCPLAHYMKWLSKFYGTLGISSNDQCISCTQCSKYCQVGVDVMAFAKNQERFDNTNSSCIHCGICVTVCPVDVLSFDREK